MKDAPEGCTGEGEEEGLIVNIKKALSSLFTLQKDKCQNYYEHVHINPIFKVTPTKVSQSQNIIIMTLNLSPLQICMVCSRSKHGLSHSR